MKTSKQSKKTGSRSLFTAKINKVLAAREKELDKGNGIEVRGIASLKRSLTSRLRKAAV